MRCPGDRVHRALQGAGNGDGAGRARAGGGSAPRTCRVRARPPALPCLPRAAIPGTRLWGGYVRSSQSVLLHSAPRKMGIPDPADPQTQPPLLSVESALRFTPGTFPPSSLFKLLLSPLSVSPSSTVLGQRTRIITSAALSLHFFIQHHIPSCPSLPMQPESTTKWTMMNDAFSHWSHDKVLWSESHQSPQKTTVLLSLMTSP